MATESRKNGLYKFAEDHNTSKPYDKCIGEPANAAYGQCSITRKLDKDQNAGLDVISTNDCHKRVPSVLLSTRQGLGVSLNDWVT